MVMAEVGTGETDQGDALPDDFGQREETATRQQAVYFGFSETHTVMFPDGVSYVEHTTLNEGARRAYLNNLNRDVRFQRATGDAIMKMSSGDERYELLRAAVVGWNLLGPEGKPMVFSKGSPGAALEQFLDKADPKIIDLIEKDVRKHNPWLLNDVTVEEIDKQIAELTDLRKTKVAEEAGKAS